MGVRPLVDQVVAQMQMPKLIEPFGQGGQSQPGTQKQKALDQLLVSRHGNLLQGLNCRRSDVVLDIMQRYPQPAIQRLVKSCNDQEGGVHALHIVKENQRGSPGVQPRRMVIVLQRDKARSHGEFEGVQNLFLLFGTCSVGPQCSAQGTRHLLRTPGQSSGFFSHSTSPVPCRSFSSLASVKRRSDNRFR